MPGLHLPDSREELHCPRPPLLPLPRPSLVVWDVRRNGVQHIPISCTNAAEQRLVRDLHAWRWPDLNVVARQRRHGDAGEGECLAQVGGPWPGGEDELVECDVTLGRLQDLARPSGRGSDERVQALGGAGGPDTCTEGSGKPGVSRTQLE